MTQLFANINTNVPSPIVFFRFSASSFSLFYCYLANWRKQIKLKREWIEENKKSYHSHPSYTRSRCLFCLLTQTCPSAAMNSSNDKENKRNDDGREREWTNIVSARLSCYRRKYIYSSLTLFSFDVGIIYFSECNKCIKLQIFFVFDFISHWRGCVMSPWSSSTTSWRSPFVRNLMCVIIPQFECRTTNASSMRILWSHFTHPFCQRCIITVLLYLNPTHEYSTQLDCRLPIASRSQVCVSSRLCPKIHCANTKWLANYNCFGFRMTHKLCVNHAPVPAKRDNTHVERHTAAHHNLYTPHLVCVCCLGIQGVNN